MLAFGHASVGAGQRQLCPLAEQCAVKGSWLAGWLAGWLWFVARLFGSLRVDKFPPVEHVARMEAHTRRRSEFSRLYKHVFGKMCCSKMCCTS